MIDCQEDRLAIDAMKFKTLTFVQGQPLTGK
jgi:hypothetical protein